MQDGSASTLAVHVAARGTRRDHVPWSGTAFSFYLVLLLITFLTVFCRSGKTASPPPSAQLHSEHDDSAGVSSSII